MERYYSKRAKIEYPTDLQFEILYSALYVVANTIASLEMARGKNEKVSRKLMLQVDLLLKLVGNSISKAPETTTGSFKDLGDVIFSV